MTAPRRPLSPQAREDLGFAIARAIREDRQFIARRGRVFVDDLSAIPDTDPALLLAAFKKFFDMLDGRGLPSVEVRDG